MRSIDKVRDAYGAVVARLVRFSAIGTVMVAVAAAGIIGLSKFTPTEVSAWRMIRARCSWWFNCLGARRSHAPPDVVKQAEEILKKEEVVADFLSVVGLNFIDNYSQPNAAFMVVTLKPFEERKEASQNVHAPDRPAGRAQFRQIQREASSFHWCRHPSSDLERGGGFSFMSSKTCAAATSKVLAQTLRGLVVAANQNPSSAGCSPHSRRPTPRSISISIADKAQNLGVPLSAVFQAMQASLGGSYVNDVNLYGRRWARSRFRQRRTIATMSMTSTGSMSEAMKAR